MLNPLAECFYPSESQNITDMDDACYSPPNLRPLNFRDEEHEAFFNVLYPESSTELPSHRRQPITSTQFNGLYDDGFFAPLPTPPQSPVVIDTSIASRPSTFREYLLPKPHATTPKAVGVLSNPCTLVTGDLGPLELLQMKPMPQSISMLSNEALGKICEAAIVFDKRAGASLLLTCKQLHEITLIVYRNAAKEYARDQDPVAAVLFEPTSDWDLYLDWMPRLLSRSSPIPQLLHEAERLHNVYRWDRKPLLEPFANSDALPVFKVGLYLLGMLHFRHAQDLSTGLVEAFLDGLPRAALLVLRVTSIMMHALFCHEYSLGEYYPPDGSTLLGPATRIRDRDLIQEVRFAAKQRHDVNFDPKLVACAFEKLLLTSGLRWPAFSWDHKGVWSVKDGDPLVYTLGDILRNIAYCKSLDPDHPVVVRMRRSRYDIQVTDRIAARYHGEVGLLSQEWQRLDRLLVKIGEWTDGRTEMQVLNELKATAGVLPN